VAVTFSVIFFRSELEAMSLAALCNVTTVVALGAAWSIPRTAPRGIWSPSSVYLITFLLFHVGLTAAFGLGHEPTGEIGEGARLWLFRPSTKTALWLTCVGICGFTIGVRLAYLRPPAPHRPGPNDADLDRFVRFAGVGLTVGGLLAWFAVVLARGGPALMIGSYSRFLDATGGSPLPWAYRGIEFGLVLLAASRWSRGHSVAVGIFVAWSLIAFPLGLRGEILFPLFAALAVAAMRRVPMRTSRSLLLAIALLWSVAIIRDLRATGLESIAEVELSATPIDGIAEMGASLRPVSEVVFWHQMGDRFDLGATYWAPIDRALFHVVPGWERLPIEDDDRIMNVLTMKRAGPIGFSPVAEAYRNFSAYGAFFVMMLFGILLGRIDTFPNSRVYQCIAGVVLVTLLSHVRNNFVHVPVQALTGFAMVATLVFLARAREAKQRHAHGARGE
jgi:hypothetical protein